MSAGTTVKRPRAHVLEDFDHLAEHDRSLAAAADADRLEALEVRARGCAGANTVVR